MSEYVFGLLTYKERRELVQNVEQMRKDLEAKTKAKASKAKRKVDNFVKKCLEGEKDGVVGVEYNEPPPTMHLWKPKMKEWNKEMMKDGLTTGTASYLECLPLDVALRNFFHSDKARTLLNLCT